jgi:hypothetical protein
MPEPFLSARPAYACARLWTTLLAGLVLVAGCGGGGGAAPSAGAGSRGGSGLAPTASASITMVIPAGASPSGFRRVRTISPDTQSVLIAVSGGYQQTWSQAFNVAPPSCVTSEGGTSCTFTVTAFVGSDTFAITTFDGPNGTGTPLDAATQLVTISSGAPNTVSVTLEPVAPTPAPTGTPAPSPSPTGANLGITIVVPTPAPLVASLPNGVVIGSSPLPLSVGTDQRIVVSEAGYDGDYTATSSAPDVACLLQSGQCVASTTVARDAYGNHVLTIHPVAPGGSRIGLTSTIGAAAGFSVTVVSP